MPVPMNPQGLYEDLAHGDYLAGPGISKSMLDWIHQSPALLSWANDAPVDEAATKAVDLGNAFEMALLEPARFENLYITAPDVDRRTNAGKAEYAEFLEEAKGRIVLKSDERRQIELMVESTFAHPMARRVLEADHVVQGSYYWIDSVTDELCRCRPDLLCTELPFGVDVKTSADMGRFKRSTAEFRYHVQDAFYSDGLADYYGDQPHFLFLVVFTSLSAGRYPVHVMELDIDAKHQGVNEYRADMERYIACREQGDFTHIEELRLPGWARANTDL